MKFLLLLAALASSASAFQSKTPETTKLKKEVQDLLSRLAGLPIEIEADGILLLLDAGQISPDQAPVILDRLFVDSGRAILKSPLRGLYPDYQDADGSVPSVVASASRLGLNQLSLQTRILARFRTVNLKHTVSLFDRISLTPASRSCADSLSPVFDTYYQSLLPLYSDLVKKADKKQRESATDWLFEHLSVRQDGQIAPVADTLRKLPAQREELEFGIARLAQDLTNLNPSFLPYINSLEKTTEALISLAKSASLAGVSPMPLWRAFATYNRNALKGSRCRAFPRDKLNASIELVKTKSLFFALPDDIASEFAGLMLIEPGGMDDAKP